MLWKLRRVKKVFHTKTTNWEIKKKKKKQKYLQFSWTLTEQSKSIFSLQSSAFHS